MALALTETASKHVKKILEEQKLQGVFLRMGVKGGGCSGLSYSLEFDSELGPHDKKFEVDGVTVVCDAKSYLYLNGTTLDYVTEGLQGGFTFINPQAKSSCGCGTSFTRVGLARHRIGPWRSRGAGRTDNDEILNGPRRARSSFCGDSGIRGDDVRLLRGVRAAAQAPGRPGSPAAPLLRAVAPAPPRLPPRGQRRGPRLRRSRLPRSSTEPTARSAIPWRASST